MKPVLTGSQIRRLERGAVANGVSIPTLMENAGSALAERALHFASPEGRFAILCGRGNNGGDGLVAARKLAEAGRRFQLEVIGGKEKLAAEAVRLYESLARASSDFSPGPGDVVVDALLGTGVNRNPEGDYAQAIGRIDAWRRAGAWVLSADLPSGLDTDSGRPYEPCVWADATLAFGHLKLAHVLEPGASRCRVVQCADIGLPASSSPFGEDSPTFLLELSDVLEWFPKRQADSHKGTYGHALIVAGSPGRTGAAALCGMGALRAGAGLASIACRPEAINSVLAHAPELMGLPLPGRGGLAVSDLGALCSAAEGKQAVVIGPGIDRGEETAELLRLFLAQLSVPCLLDADGLNAVARHLDVLSSAKGPLILTPHPGEMARLIGSTSTQVQRERLAVARSLATSRKLVVVLKGARTLVALPDGTVFVNPTGNAGMATAGTGDVLAGICGGLLAQKLTPARSAAVAVYAHGRAGDIAAQRVGQAGLVASDLLTALGEQWRRLER